jgi:quercetin dioxygenase-like cupin family protein
MAEVLRLENRHTGEVLQLRRVRDRDGRTALLIDGSLPPRSSGPPPHVHWQQCETGTVIAGSLGGRCGKEPILLRAGEPAVFPAGVAHAWWNAGDDVLEFSGRATPASDLDRFLQAMFAIVNSAPSGRPSIFYVAHVLWRHRHTQGLATPPLIVQRFLFPLIVTIGRVLGKYRGVNWPGCPESCTGAPDIEPHGG